MMPVKMNIKTKRNADDQPTVNIWNFYHCSLPCTRAMLQIIKMDKYRVRISGVLFFN